MSASVDQISSMLDRFSAIWKTNNGTALANLFVEDGVLVNPFGQRANGRSTVGAMYSEFFGTLLKDTSTTISLGTVRPVGHDHAFVDAEQSITAPDGTPVLSVHLAALMRRDPDGWRFVDARPYSFASLPG